MDAKGVLEFAKKHGAKILDLRFIDVPGVWQHVSYPIGELSEDSFKEGFGFDASSIRGWASIHESDMLLIPDPNTAFIDPFLTSPTLVMIGDATDPPSQKPYHRDPRHVAKRAEAYLKSTGIADTAFFGAEAEFFILDSIRFDSAPQHSYYFIDSDEGRWNTGRENDGDYKNLGYRTRFKEGYFPVRPWITTRTCARKWF
jgi:glutamine synthetase